MTDRYNVAHGFDMEEEAISARIKAWQKSQQHEAKIMESLETRHEEFFSNEKAYHKWSQKDGSVKDVNRAREKMINGLTQFMDGLGELKEISGSWIVDPDYLNLIFMTAFARSTFYEKTIHWTKAEEKFQKERNTSLPGGFSGNGDEIIVRPFELQWFSLQFLFRQLEFTRFVPNYEVMSGIWCLETNATSSCSKLLDQWYYIHKDKIEKKSDLTDFTRGYFFRYNAHMTSDAQAQVLFILNNLFRYSMSKPMGTLEYPPWFCDSTITGKNDGNLPHSKNIIPHKIDLSALARLNSAPIVYEEVAGMKTIPDEAEEAKDFEDKELAKSVVKKKYDSKDALEHDVEKKEKKRDKIGYKSKWDGEKVLDLEEGRVWLVDGKVVKLKMADGTKVDRLPLLDGGRYKLGQVLEE